MRSDLGDCYSIIETEQGDAIGLQGGVYDGIVFRFGKVQLIPEEDRLRLKFEYDIIEGSVDDAADFIDHIGPILVELIEEGVVKNNIVYTGGT